MKKNWVSSDDSYLFSTGRLSHAKGRDCFPLGRPWLLDGRHCWQQIEMSGFVVHELSTFSTPVVENVEGVIDSEPSLVSANYLARRSVPVYVVHGVWPTNRRDNSEPVSLP